MGHALGNNYGKSYSFLSKPVNLDLQFTVAAADTGGLGVTGVTGQGVENVFMHTSQTPGRGPNGYLNPNPATGLALIQLAYNYAELKGGPINIKAPLTGSALAINGSALTAGQPYQITSVGAGTEGAYTIAPVADVSGSLASTWMRLPDSYGNTFIVWFSVSGTGSAPVGVSGTMVQQSIATNDTAATIGAALVVTLNGLRANTLQNPSAPNVAPFSAAGTTTVTVTNTQSPATPFPGPAADGTAPTGFTFALTKFNSNLTNWQTVGVPKGIVPAVGVSFIATATGQSVGGGSSGLVKAIGVSSVVSAEIIGNPNLSIGPIPMGGSPNVGSWLLLQFMGATNSSTTTLIPTNPADTSQVFIQLTLEQAARVGGNNE